MPKSNFNKVAKIMFGTAELINFGKYSLYPFLADVPILYLLKVPRSSNVFRRYKKGDWAETG